MFAKSLVELLEKKPEKYFPLWARYSTGDNFNYDSCDQKFFHAKNRRFENLVKYPFREKMLINLKLQFCLENTFWCGKCSLLACVNAPV